MQNSEAVGFFNIRNNIAEALSHINTSEYETRLTWVIMRKTWGWNKEVDAISISQFEKATGINRGNIHRALTRLADKKILLISREGHINKYQININTEQWIYSERKIIVDKDNVVSSKNIVPMQANLFSTNTSISTSQETLTKDIKTKEQKTNNNTLSKNQTSLQKLVEYYKSLYKNKFGKEPVMGNTSWGKWGKQLKVKLDQGYSLREVGLLLQVFAKSKDSDPERLGFDLGIFFSDFIFNKMIAIKNKNFSSNTGGKYDKY